MVASSAPLGDRLNMVYSGCSVTYGHGEAVVTATGMNTEMGHIAGILNNEKQTQTPLQKKLAQLGRMLGVLAIIICAVIFAIGLASGMELMEIFMVSISLAVSAIPEGLPAIVTHRAVHRCYPAGQAQCHHSKTPRCRDTGRCFGDLLR